MTPYERLAVLERTEQDRIIKFLLEAENDLVKKLNVAQDRGATGTARILRERQAEIQRTLDSMQEGSRQWADQASRSIYTGSMDVTDANLKKLGLTLDVTASYGAPIHAEAIRVLADATYAPLSGYIGQVGRKVDDVFRSIQLQEARAALTGVETQASMARNIKKALEAQDVFAFTDKSGRDWTLNRYSQMVSRTLIRECETQGSANRMVQLGYTLGEVSYNRGAEPPCDVCRSWEGRIIDLDGSSQGKYPTIEQARAGGLWHPNCFHNLLPHLEGTGGTTKRPEAGRGEPTATKATPKKVEAPKGPPRFKEKSEATQWMKDNVADAVDLDFMEMDALQETADALFDLTVGAGRPKLAYIKHGEYRGSLAYVSRGENGIHVSKTCASASRLNERLAKSADSVAARKIKNLAYLTEQIEGLEKQLVAAKATGDKVRVREINRLLKFQRANVEALPERFLTGNTLREVMIHEYGHVIHGQLPKGMMDEDVYMALGGTGRGRWRSLIDGNMKKDVKKQASSMVSEYAATNTFEFFAEAFTLYITGHKAKLPPGMVQIIEDVIARAYTK